MILSSITDDNIKAVLENLDFKSNFSAEIRTVNNIPANSEFSVPHGLKSIPSGRIILKQTDGGWITDGITQWTGRIIYMYNNGNSIRELKVLILR